MTLRIAFSGPNLPLNESLSRVVRDLMYSEDLDFYEVSHPMMKVVESTGWDQEKFDGHNIDWMNLWSVSIMRMNLERIREIDVVTSPSCGVDNVCLQATWLAEQVDRAQVGLSLVDPMGNPIASGETVWINRSGAILQTILNSTEEEFISFWDFVYAVLPVEVELSTATAPLLIQYRDFITTIPAFQGIIHLPDNLDAATDALKNEVGKWKEKLFS